jgi:antitoxin YefM
MKTLSVSEAKMKFNNLVQTVHNTDEGIMITRNGRPAAILVSPDEYDSLKETMVIRSDKDLMHEIRRGLYNLKHKAKLYTLDELCA